MPGINVFPTQRSGHPHGADAAAEGAPSAAEFAACG